MAIIKFSRIPEDGETEESNQILFFDNLEPDAEINTLLLAPGEYDLEISITNRERLVIPEDERDVLYSYLRRSADRQAENRLVGR